MITLTVLLLPIAVLAWNVSIESAPVTVDGSVEEWPAEPTYRGEIDAWLLWWRGELFLRFDLPVPLEGVDRLDVLYLFLDVDADPDTGFLVGAIGADSRAEIAVWKGAAYDAILCEFQTFDTPSWDGGGFGGCAGIAAGVAGRHVEVQVPMFRLDTDPLPGFPFRAELRPAVGPAVVAQYGEPGSWTERFSSLDWADGIRADGDYGDWATASAPPQIAEADATNRHDILSVRSVVSAWNTSALVELAPAALDAELVLAPRAPPEPRSEERAVQVSPTREPREAVDHRDWIVLNATRDGGANESVVLRGQGGRVLAVHHERGGELTGYPTFGAFVRGQLELQVRGSSWVGASLSILSARWDLRAWDNYSFVIPLEPNPPELLDVSGNQRYWLRNTAHGTETACTGTNDKVASTTQGAGPVQQITLVAGQDACWYADATTGTTIIAGTWEALLDLATTSGNVDAYIYPITGTSTYFNTWDSQNAGCTVTTHFNCVDEVWPPDDATSYVITLTTTNDKESHLMQNLAITAGFTDIDITIEYRCGAASNAAGGDSSMLIRVGTEEYVGTINDCLLTWLTFVDFRELSPSGDEWTAADVNAAECGYVSGGDVNPDPFVSACRLRIQVTYPTTEYDVQIQVWNKTLDSVTSTVISCLDQTATGDDVRCFSAGVAEQIVAFNEVVRIRIAHSSAAGTVVVDYDDADSTGDSRMTLPIPEFSEVLLPIGGTLVAAVAAAWRRRRSP